MAKGWDIAKEALGFLGAVLMAFPWLRDFLLRLKRDWLNQLPIGGSFTDARRHFVEVFSRRNDQPKPADLLTTLLGIALLAASFLIGLGHALLTNAG